MKINKAIDKIPSSILWYFACAATALTFLLWTASSWVYVGIIFLLYIAGILFGQLEYKRGVLDTTRRHNDAMEKLVTEQKEWLANFHATSV